MKLAQGSTFRSSISFGAALCALAAGSVARAAPQSGAFVGRQDPDRSYFPEPTYARYFEEPSVASGDLDGDGREDIVVTSQDETLFVFLQDGRGEFVDSVYSTAAVDPQAVGLFDVDGDGSLDIWLVGRDNHLVEVFWNAGDGSFPTATPRPTGLRPEDLAVGDFDGDGVNDLATANSQGGAISVIPGQGGRAFGQPTAIVFGTPVTSIEAADLDKDGNTDLLATFGDGTLRVLPGGGDGTFGPAIDHFVGETLSALHVSDLDGDGWLDALAIDDRETLVDRFLVLRNDGAGMLSPPDGRDVPFLHDLVVADMNGDGHPDVATSSADLYSSLAPGKIGVYLNDGSGAFLLDRRYPNLSAGPLAALEVGGDGDTDIAQVTPVGNLTIYHNHRNRSLRAQRRHPLPEHPVEVKAADLNGDGLSDLVADAWATSSLFVLLNEGNAQLSDSPEVLSASTAADVTLADLDGDGSTDILTATMSSSLEIFWNSGSGSFSPGPLLDSGVFMERTTASDLNGDGALDLIAADTSFGISVLLSASPGVYPSAPQIYPLSAGSRAVAAGDLDADGDVDLGTLEYLAQSVLVLENTGNGSLLQGTSFHVPDLSELIDLKFADVTGDGMLDAVVGGGPSLIGVLENTGAGALLPLTTFEGNDRLLLSDFDGDGDLDVASSSFAYPRNGTLRLHLNRGGGLFRTVGHYLASDAGGFGDCGDFDGNGFPDVALANYGPNDSSVSLLLRRPLPPTLRWSD